LKNFANDNVDGEKNYLRDFVASLFIMSSEKFFILTS